MAMRRQDDACIAARRYFALQATGDRHFTFRVSNSAAMPYAPADSSRPVISRAAHEKCFDDVPDNVATELDENDAFRRAGQADGIARAGAKQTKVSTPHYHKCSRLSRRDASISYDDFSQYHIIVKFMIGHRRRRASQAPASFKPLEKYYMP